jgi:hypothetical protein
MTKAASKSKNKTEDTGPTLARFKYSGDTTSIEFPIVQEVTLIDGKEYDLPPQDARVVRLQSRGSLTQIKTLTQIEGK